MKRTWLALLLLVPFLLHGCGKTPEATRVVHAALPVRPGGVVQTKTLTVDNSSNANTLTNYLCSVTLTASNVTWANLDHGATNIRILVGGVKVGHWVEAFNGHAQTCVVWFKVPSITASSATAATATLQILSHGSVIPFDTSIFLVHDAAGVYNNHDWLQGRAVMAGEHSIIVGGFIYAGSFDPDGGIPTGVVQKINADTGELVAQATAGAYLASAPGNFGLHVFAYSKQVADGEGCEVAKILKSDMSVVSRYQAGTTLIDWEALPIDSVNGNFLVPLSGGGLRAVSCTSMASVWTNTDPDMSPTAGAANVPVPLKLGDYWYVFDADAKVWKINAATGVTASSLALTEATQDDTYCVPIYDETRNVIYWANGGGANGNKVYAVNPGIGAAAPTVAWSVVLPDAATYEVRRPMALDATAGKLYALSRLIASPYKTRLICLDVTASGATLWTNTTAWDHDVAIAQVIVDSEYAYCATTDYLLTGWNKLIVVRVSDGMTLQTHDLIAESASCGCYAIGGGRVAVGLWGLVLGKHQGYQCIRVRDGGGYGDSEFKFNYYRTGFFGSMMSGNLRTTPGSTTLDTTTAWDLYASTGGTGGGTQTDGRYLQVGNGTAHRGLRSKATLVKGGGATPGTAIRVKARNWPETPTGAWGKIIGLAPSGNFPNVEPVRWGRFLTTHNCSYDQGGTPTSVTIDPHLKRHDQTYDIKMHEPRLQLDLDGVSQLNKSDWATSFDNFKLHLTCSDTDAILEVDYVFARPFSYPEPTVSVS